MALSLQGGSLDRVPRGEHAWTLGFNDQPADSELGYQDVMAGRLVVKLR